SPGRGDFVDGIFFNQRLEELRGHLVPPNFAVFPNRLRHGAQDSWVQGGRRWRLDRLRFPFFCQSRPALHLRAIRRRRRQLPKPFQVGDVSSIFSRPQRIDWTHISLLGLHIVPCLGAPVGLVIGVG